jgi:hypothetical protein
MQQDKIDQEMSLKTRQRLLDAHVETEADLRRQLQSAIDDFKTLEKSHDELRESDKRRQNFSYELKRTLEESQRELA